MQKTLTPNGILIPIDDNNPILDIEGLILLKELVEAGKIKSVIDRSYLLEQTAEVHRYVKTGGKKVNVVITLEHNRK